MVGVPLLVGDEGYVEGHNPRIRLLTTKAALVLRHLHETALGISAHVTGPCLPRFHLSFLKAGAICKMIIRS